MLRGELCGDGVGNETSRSFPSSRFSENYGCPETCLGRDKQIKKVPSHESTEVREVERGLKW